MKMQTIQRNGQAWTEQEDIDLEHELKLGMEISEIAQKHQRSDRAIRLRFANLLRRLMAQKKSKHFLASYFSVSPAYIDGILSECNDTSKMGILENDMETLKRRMKKLESALLKVYKKLKNDKTK
ncbi:MAG: hypothetical protein CMM15_01705 [Rhodospirillaceae bacterium]|nr:hypothetical protein [Rhodospirillaceae bacterium]|tara:strand:- start:3578 stop:3952 length:375 start_codon:yes stop_codon:yes gene_type:complete